MNIRTILRSEIPAFVICQLGVCRKNIWFANDLNLRRIDLKGITNGKVKVNTFCRPKLQLRQVCLTMMMTSSMYVYVLKCGFDNYKRAKETNLYDSHKNKLYPSHVL